jgi:branched-chain amino acid transport system substrate-binding protein
MRGTVSGRRTALPRTIGTGLLAVLVVAVAACGSSSKHGSGSTPTTASAGPATTASTASLLGPAAPATGTPVKIGLITNGGQCNGCSNGDDEPVARATVEWLNAHMKGLAGHPITLDVCVDANDPGKTTDCANQMIRDNVAAVVVGASGVVGTTWNVLHNAKIPLITNSTTNTPMLDDTQSTFVLNDPGANTVAFPIGVAKQAGAKKVSVIVVDVPAATDIYKAGKAQFTQAGLDVQIVPVALGTADMTPQAQQVVSNNPDGVVMIVGQDSFCIPAIQGLESLGFHGTIATISYCVTDAMRKAIPSNVVKGIQLSSIAPINDNSNPMMQQYAAVLDTYAKGKNIDPNGSVGIGTYQAVAALSTGTAGLTGAVTPASVTTALKTMQNAKLLPSGLYFRCNGNAVPSEPGACSAGVLAATLDSKGYPQTYTVINNNPVPS